MPFRRTRFLALLLSLLALLATTLGSVVPVSPAHGSSETQSARGITQPSAPRGVATTTDIGAVNVRWRPPGNNGGSRIVGYVLRISAARSGPWSLYNTFDAKARRTTIAGLPQGAVLWVRIQAKNKKRTGKPSAPVMGMAADWPDQPTGLTATPGEDGTVQLSWDVPDGGGLPITGYYVFQASTGPFESIGESTTNQFTVPDGSLSSGTEYLFKVRARNEVGDGPLSDSVAITPTGGVPGAPTIMQAELIDGRLKVGWAMYDLSGGAVDSYTIERLVQGAWTPVPNVTFSGNTGTAALATVHNQVYPLRVTATNESGTGLPSPVVMIKGAMPPNLPLVPVLTADADSVHVEWSQAAASDGRPEATATRARIAEESTCTGPDACFWYTYTPLTLSGFMTWSDLPGTDDDVAPSTAYRVQVLSCADGGESYARIGGEHGSGSYAVVEGVCSIFSAEVTTQAGQ